MIVFLVKFWEGLKKIVLGIIAAIVFFGGMIYDDIKRTYTNFSINCKLLWEYIVTGSTGDLMVKPSLISVIIYLLFSSRNPVDPIKDPGDYKITIIGYVGVVPTEALIQLIADYQMIDLNEARKIIEVNNLRFELANGVKETRVAELKKQFEDAGAILEIIRTGINENAG